MSNYGRRLQTHLSDYKLTRLGILEYGIFKYRGVDIACGHILPITRQWENISKPYRAAVQTHVSGRLKLHRYFHHLNSSQAFAFNLFFPFFTGGPEASGALLRSLGLNGDVATWDFEVIADLKEGTNVDAAWTDSKGSRTYCEVKHSEQEFGQAKPDERHLQKLREIYEPILRGQCESELLQHDKFFERYQILRNVWLAAREPSARVLFLLPAANDTLWPALHDVTSRLAPALRERVHSISVEQVLETLAVDSLLSSELHSHTQEMVAKFVPKV